MNKDLNKDNFIEDFFIRTSIIAGNASLTKDGKRNVINVKKNDGSYVFFSIRNVDYLFKGYDNIIKNGTSDKKITLAEVAECSPYSLGDDGENIKVLTEDNYPSEALESLPYFLESDSSKKIDKEKLSRKLVAFEYGDTMSISKFADEKDEKMEEQIKEIRDFLSSKKPQEVSINYENGESTVTIVGKNGMTEEHKFGRDKKDSNKEPDDYDLTL